MPLVSLLDLEKSLKLGNPLFNSNTASQSHLLNLNHQNSGNNSKMFNCGDPSINVNSLNQNFANNISMMMSNSQLNQNNLLTTNNNSSKTDCLIDLNQLQLQLQLQQHQQQNAAVAATFQLQHKLLMNTLNQLTLNSLGANIALNSPSLSSPSQQQSPSMINNLLNSSTNSANSKSINYSRYKTELCRQYNENGECKYGDKCQFAHGFLDLKDVNRHPKYKTDFCKTFHSKGFCPYGPRCHFIHELNEKFETTSPQTNNNHNKALQESLLSYSAKSLSHKKSSNQLNNDSLSFISSSYPETSTTLCNNQTMSLSIISNHSSTSSSLSNSPPLTTNIATSSSSTTTSTSTSNSISPINQQQILKTDNNQKLNKSAALEDHLLFSIINETIDDEDDGMNLNEEELYEHGRENHNSNRINENDSYSLINKMKDSNTHGSCGDLFAFVTNSNSNNQNVLNLSPHQQIRTRSLTSSTSSAYSSASSTNSTIGSNQFLSNNINNKDQHTSTIASSFNYFFA